MLRKPLDSSMRLAEVNGPSLSHKKLRSPGILVLAAGMGKRMRSPLPKVLHSICGKPLIFHLISRIREVSPGSSIAFVVGHGKEAVEKYIRSELIFEDLEIHFIVQTEQRGTGHAARCAMESPWGQEQIRKGREVLVLPGDLPLISRALVTEMLQPLGSSESVRLLTCDLPVPTGYGRVVRKGKAGPVQRIIEEKDASARQRQIQEVGASIYLLNAEFFGRSLARLRNQNVQGEYYLTDLIEMAAKSRKKVGVLRWNVPQDLRGVNDPWELAEAQRLLNERCLRAWASQGVRIMDPIGTHLDVTVELSDQVTLHPGVILRGKTRIGRDSVIGPGAVLTDTEVGSQVTIKTGTVVENSKIATGAQVGPYAHLRPESVVGPGVKIGNFVELKKTVVNENSSIAHLSYLGDAEVGKNVNIGCGFVTCNFDGRVVDGKRKHRTIIEDDVFLGSDCQVIAPVRIGKGAYVASGSTITEDVEPESLAIARSRQVNKPGYAKKVRGKS